MMAKSNSVSIWFGRDPRRPRSTRLQGSEDLGDVIEVETRATGEQLARIAVADVDQHVRLEAPVGEELRIDLRSVETCHRTRIESHRPQRDDEIGDLQRSVLKRAAGGELRISRKPGLCVRVRKQKRQMLVELL